MKVCPRESLITILKWNEVASYSSKFGLALAFLQLFVVDFLSHEVITKLQVNVDNLLESDFFGHFGQRGMLLGSVCHMTCNFYT